MSDLLANPRKGEAVVKIGDDEYVVRYTFGVLVKLQKATGKNINELFAAMGQGDLELMGKVLHAGIEKGKKWPDRYSDKAPTLEQIYDELVPPENDQYLLALSTALHGAEFTEAIEKKLKAAREKALQEDPEGE